MTTTRRTAYIREVREEKDQIMKRADELLNEPGRKTLTKAEKELVDQAIARAEPIAKEIRKWSETTDAEFDQLEHIRATYGGTRAERAMSSTSPIAGVTYSMTERDPGHYGHARAEHSWIVDAVAASKGSSPAQRRQAEMDAFTREQIAALPPERRDLHVGPNAGQEAVVPLFLQDRFERFRTAGAVTANLANQQGLPDVGRSVTIPVQTGEASVAELAQASPLNSISETTATFDEETADVIEVAGAQDVSLMVIERGGFAVDTELGAHLAQLVARDEDQRVLAAMTSDAGVSVTYTAATGSLAEIYKKAANVAQQIHTGNFAPPTAIIVHPRRFSAWASELDNNNRPLMVPNANGPQNAIAAGVSTGEPVAEGYTGYHLMGMPIYLDANITTTTGSGTNQDVVYIADMSAVYLWRAPVAIEVDRSTLFKKSGATVRARRYMAVMASHRTAGIGKITGTGLATPVW
jgi:HK97 family phage major capsid protein